VLIALLYSSVSAYQPPTNLDSIKTNKVTTNRREAISKFVATTLVSTAFFPNENVEALEACPAKANNCVRTTWTPPSSTSSKDAISIVKEVIATYPQEGQADVDGGGWVYVADDFGTTGLAKLEFKSSGKGNFAKFFNGGKAFVDDFNVEVEESGVVQIRSQSRVGDSDFGVNAKRVDFLARALKAKGWSV